MVQTLKVLANRQFIPQMHPGRGLDATIRDRFF
jgi:hypothetical protein